MDKKVLIAMSGGVDSSVAAFLLREKGYNCIGVTMKLFENDPIGVNPQKSCCSLEDVEDARSVAHLLRIPYYVFNFCDDFKNEVVEKFVISYENGYTPNPCIDCNKFMKFDKLFLRAKQLGYDFVSTGHYAEIERKSDRFMLKKAIDKNKDQSYVLYFLTQSQLSRLILPLGSLTKSEVRMIADKNGFINAKKKDSYDICFVPDGNYAAFIENYRHQKYPCGSFVDKNGKLIGIHNGQIRYTIGQRKGLGISSEKPLYVLNKDSSCNTVTLGYNDDLFSREFNAKDFNFILFETPPTSFRAKAKIRYRQEEQWASISVLDEKNVHIVFDENQRAITKGQSVVLYLDEYVVGGGIIC